MISFLIENNKKIRDFLEGDDSCIPISEYRYLHDRPLVRPSFLTEIDQSVQDAGTKMISAKFPLAVAKKYADELGKHAITLGKNLEGDMTDEKAKTILLALREVYRLSQKIIKGTK